jgi:hypothetical protein
MLSQSHSLIMRVTLASIAATLGIALFLTGVWAGSARGGSGHPQTAPIPSSFWRYDQETGNPTGPHGQVDFWNYDPATGAKISNFSPGVAPQELGTLWSVQP